jgi:hypothetical protein
MTPRRFSSILLLTVRGSSSISLLIASVGLLLAVAGLVILVVDVSSPESGTDRGTTLYSLATSPTAERIPFVEDFADWLRNPRSLTFLNRPVVFVLDLIPQSLALMVIGGLIVWKSWK